MNTLSGVPAASYIPQGIPRSLNTNPKDKSVLSVDNTAVNVQGSMTKFNLMDFKNIKPTLFKSIAILLFSSLTTASLNAQVINGIGPDGTYECTDVPVFSSPTASGGCTGVATLTFEDAVSGTSCAGDIVTRTWTATDACGDTSTGSQTMEPTDDVSPVIAGVGADGIFDCLETPVFSSPTASDDCSTATITFVDAISGSNCAGDEITRTWTATDECGNTATASQTMDSYDSLEPQISGIGADGTYTCGATPIFSSPTADEDCSTATITFTDAVIGTNCAGDIIRRTWMATDDCGNYDSGSQTLSPVDNVDPMVVGVGPDGTYECGATPVFSSPTASDDCSSATLTFVDTPSFGGCAGSGITRTWTATDDCGNTSTDAQNMMPIDNTPPIISGVGPDGTYNCATGSPAFSSPTASDNCSTATITFIEEIVGTNCGGDMVRRSWTATDECGNTATAQQTISPTGECMGVVMTSDLESSYTCMTEDAEIEISAEAPGGIAMDFELQVFIGGVWTTITTQSFPAPTAVETAVFTIAAGTIPSCTPFRVQVITGMCFINSEEASLVIHTPGQMACNADINFSLPTDCMADLNMGTFLAHVGVNCAGDDPVAYADAFYEVIFEAPNGATILIDDLPDYAGQCITFSAVDGCFPAQSCWGTICVEDKLLPELVCQCPVGGNPITGDYDDACTLKCFQLEYIQNGIEDVIACPYLLFPNAIDNCTGYAELIQNISYADEVVELPNCDEHLFRRHYSLFTDQYNSETGQIDKIVAAECTYEYYVTGYDTADTTGVYDLADLALLTDDELANNLFLPLKTVVLPCGHDTDPASIAAYFDLPGNPAPSGDVPNTPVIENHEGYPYAYPFYYAMGSACLYHPQAIDNKVCNILTSYTDTYAETCGEDCGGNAKTIRDWVILDWCNSEIIRWEQFIKATDTTPPTFEVASATFSADPWDCTASFDLPLPAHLHDNCYGPVSYVVSNLDGYPITGDASTGYSVTDVPKSMTDAPHIFYYQAIDCCGNASVPTPVEIHVIDATPPVAVTLENAVIGLSSQLLNTNGVAKLYATDMDNGSYDLCGDIKIEIRRMSDACDRVGNDTYNDNGDPDDDKDDTDNGEYVTFCCADLTDDDNGIPFGIVEVEIRVWDDANMDGVPGTSGDNYNLTWAHIRVEDKGGSIPICPVNIVLECTMDPFDLDVTGVPTVFNTCTQFDIDWEHDVNVITVPATKTPNDAAELNDIVGATVLPFNPSCRTGALKRTFNGCVQWIILMPQDVGFDPNTIQFPADVTVDCMDDEEIPTWLDDACDLIVHGVERDTFYLQEVACARIVNHWSVINWCQHDPNDPDNNDVVDPDDDGIIPGLYTHNQIVTLIDNDAPTLVCNSPTAFYAQNDCSSDVITLSAIGYDSGDCPSKNLSWEFVIDLWGDNTPDLVYSSHVSPNSPYYVAPTADSEEVFVSIPAGIDLSKAIHKLTVSVNDLCGNITSEHKDIQILDGKAPTPYCLNISTAFMTNGEVELWACDFDANSFDNCTAEENLRFTFSSTAPEDDPDFDQDLLCSAQVFTLAALDTADITGIIQLPIYVWDECGNSDFCVVNLRLVDNNNSPKAELSGQVLTEDGSMVNQVEIDLVADNPAYPVSDMTDQSGEYAFANNPMYFDYNISAEKNDAYLNGVSTLDLVLIQRHVLGIASLNSAYKLIAADINDDENISSIDLIELRKLILGIYAQLPDNSSWRFIPESEQLNPTQPWPFTEVISISDLASDMLDENYVGVKVGDVNGSVILNLTDGPTVDNRSNKALVLNFENQLVNSNDIVSLDIYSDNFEEISGFQFTMIANGLELVNVIAGDLEIDESNFATVHQLITSSWNNDKSISIDKESRLFTLEFRATRKLELNKALKLSDRLLQREAYAGEDLDIINVNFANATIEQAYELMQNEPNPFVNETVIPFVLPARASASISIYDVDGKLLKRITDTYEAGLNQVKIETREFSTGGLLYYQLESGEFKATKKMVVLR